tara:strand:- start:184 stop:291 length:108 start_codon:yes stop_codon:yes gene_type:complete
MAKRTEEKRIKLMNSKVLDLFGSFLGDAKKEQNTP